MAWSTEALERTGRPQSQVRRQWQILGWLAGLRYGLTLAQLAQRARVTPRTIRRDLDVLTGEGFPIERNHKGEGIAIRYVWGVTIPRHLRFLVDAAVEESTAHETTR